MASEWSDPRTVLALIQIGADLTPRIIQLFQKPADPQNLEAMTLEGLLALGYSRDQATLILAQQMQNQPPP